MPDDLNAPVAPEWHQQIPDDVRSDTALMDIATKSTEKDIPSVIKSFLHGQRRLGSAINLPGKDAKPEEVAALRTRLGEAGVIELPPGDPSKYEISKPADLPGGVVWSDDMANSFRGKAHELGLTQKQATGLVDYHLKTMAAVNEGLGLSIADGEKALREKWGADFDKNKELAIRAAGAIFKDEAAKKFFSNTALGNHPVLIETMAKIGELIQEDGSIMAPANRDAQLDEEAKWVEQVQTNPSHPDYTKYQSGDPALAERVRQYFVRRSGTAPANTPTGQRTVRDETKVSA